MLWLRHLVYESCLANRAKEVAAGGEAYLNEEYPKQAIPK